MVEASQGNRAEQGEEGGTIHHTIRSETPVGHAKTSRILHTTLVRWFVLVG